MKTESDIRQTLTAIDGEIERMNKLDLLVANRATTLLILMQTSECLRWVLNQVDGRKGTLMQNLLDRITAKRSSRAN